mgnify:CR=1 FL=1
MAANAYHRRTGNKEVAAFGLEVARWMIDTYQWTSDRSPWPDYVGGYFKLRQELPAMQAFCYAEGTAAAYQLAIRYAPDQVAYFEKSTREAMAGCARAIEEMGFDSVRVVDHIAIPPDDADRSGGRYVDVLSSLAWLAGITERVNPGSGVLILPYLAAPLTAKQIATI